MPLAVFQVIKGFDVAVTGLAVGQSNKVRVDPDDAYGQVRRTTLVLQVALGFYHRHVQGISPAVRTAGDSEMFFVFRSQPFLTISSRQVGTLYAKHVC